MVVHDGAHVLLYSANNYASADYAIGWASCVGPLGPCTDQSERPLVATTTVAAGPGHCAPVTLADGSTWLLFHAWQPDGIGTTYPGRQLWLEPITWDGGRPSVTQPTDSPQRVPPKGPLGHSRGGMPRCRLGVTPTDARVPYAEQRARP
jgi:hypothetical protein